MNFPRRWNSRLSDSEVKREYDYYHAATTSERHRPGLSKKDYERWADDAMHHFQMAEIFKAVNELTDENLAHKRSVPLFRRMWVDAVFSLVCDPVSHALLDRRAFLQLLETNRSPISPAAVTESMIRILRVKHDAKIQENQFSRWLLVVCEDMQDWEFKEGMKTWVASVREHHEARQSELKATLSNLFNRFKLPVSNAVERAQFEIMVRRWNHQGFDSTQSLALYEAINDGSFFTTLHAEGDTEQGEELAAAARESGDNRQSEVMSAVAFNAFCTAILSKLESRTVLIEVGKELMSEVPIPPGQAPLCRRARLQSVFLRATEGEKEMDSRIFSELLQALYRL